MPTSVHQLVSNSAQVNSSGNLERLAVYPGTRGGSTQNLGLSTAGLNGEPGQFANACVTKGQTWVHIAVHAQCSARRDLYTQPIPKFNLHGIGQV